MIAYIRDRAQVTIPNEIFQALNLKSGDMVDISVADNKIILKPIIMVDKDQAWFWTKKWQDAEKEAQKDIEEGKVFSAGNLDELLEKLGQ